jgi:hypothetical protein
VRDFLVNGGRILVTPDGKLMEGGGIPQPFLLGTDQERDECIRASRAYFAARRRWRSTGQIKRAARMLGDRTPTGWLVLEARL